MFLLYISVAAILVVWPRPYKQMVSISLAVSVEMPFENVNNANNDDGQLSIL